MKLRIAVRLQSRVCFISLFQISLFCIKLSFALLFRAEFVPCLFYWTCPRLSRRWGSWVSLLLCSRPISNYLTPPCSLPQPTLLHPSYQPQVSNYPQTICTGADNKVRSWQLSETFAEELQLPEKKRRFPSNLFRIMLLFWDKRCFPLKFLFTCYLVTCPIQPNNRFCHRGSWHPEFGVRGLSRFHDAGQICRNFFSRSKNPEWAVWNILNRLGFGFVFVMELEGLRLDLKIHLLCFPNILQTQSMWQTWQ